MKFQIQLLVSIMILGVVSSEHAILQNLSNRHNGTSSSCPNIVFVAKHVCSSCHHINDVNAFALQSHKTRMEKGWQVKTLTSVFLGNPTYSSSVNSRYCVFTQRYPKYNCRNHGTTDTPDWRCYSPKVNSVIAFHDKNTGHYDHNLDKYLNLK